MKKHGFNLTMLGCALLAMTVLTGCNANGGGSAGGGGGNGGNGGNGSGVGPVGGGTGPGTPGGGDGTFTDPSTDITDNGTPVAGTFTCTQSASSFNGASTTVSVNGLVGDALTPLLNGLGANTATSLLNSVINAERAIDGNLDTYSTFQLTAGALSAVDSVAQAVLFPQQLSAGAYAVFALEFPAGTVTASLLNNLTVSTFLGTVEQESRTVPQNQLALLGASVASPGTLYFGIKTTKPYDRADISLVPGVLTANVGDAMYVYELCTGGTITPSTAPTTPGGLPTGGLPTGGLPTGGLPAGGLPTGGLPTP